MSSIQDYKDLRKIVSGDIIVKCRLGNDIRRIPINQAPSYDELCLMMYRLYKNELSSPDNIVLKYTDEEGDLISMTDDLDVSHAISQSSLLKITVFDKQMQPHISKNESALVTQLTEIRDKLNDILKAAETVAEKPKDDQEKQKTPEKTYRQLSTAEMAEFLEESQNGRNSMKQEERPKEASPLRQHPFISPPSQPQPQQQQQQPQAPMPQQTPTSAYPPPPPPISTAPSSAPPPQQHMRQPSYPAPPQQPSTPIQQGYPPVSAPMPPPPGTPQSSYTPAIRPPDYNAYRAQTPTAPPSSGQYYYPMPQQQPQQQQQQQHPPQPSLPQHQPVNTGRW